MDPALLTLIAAGFGGLWLYFRATNEARLADLRANFDDRLRDRDAQIAALRDENAALEAKVEKMSDVLSRNTDALAQAAAAQETVARLLGTLVPPGPISPASIGTAMPSRPGSTDR